MTPDQYYRRKRDPKRDRQLPTTLGTVFIGRQFACIVTTLEDDPDTYSLSNIAEALWLRE